MTQNRHVELLVCRNDQVLHNLSLRELELGFGYWSRNDPGSFTIYSKQYSDGERRVFLDPPTDLTLSQAESLVREYEEWICRAGIASFTALCQQLAQNTNENHVADDKIQFRYFIVYENSSGELFVQAKHSTQPQTYRMANFDGQIHVSAKKMEVKPYGANLPGMVIST